MRDFVDGTAFNFEQGQRSRKLFAAVVLAALDDAIADDKKYGNGPDQIARWARSRDGREVLSCAGIDPNERVVQGLMTFVAAGVRTSVALSREESERRSQPRPRPKPPDPTPDQSCPETRLRARFSLPGPSPRQGCAKAPCWETGGAG
jgi:hypothetical protein